MFFIFDLFKWLWELWDKLPEKTKRQIIETTVQIFTELLRVFHRSWTNTKSKRG